MVFMVPMFSIKILRNGDDRYLFSLSVLLRCFLKCSLRVKGTSCLIDVYKVHSSDSKRTVVDMVTR